MNVPKEKSKKCLYSSLIHCFGRFFIRLELEKVAFSATHNKISDTIAKKPNEQAKKINDKIKKPCLERLVHCFGRFFIRLELEKIVKKIYDKIFYTIVEIQMNKAYLKNKSKNTLKPIYLDVYLVFILKK